MTRYVVTARREAQTGQSMAEDYVRKMPSVRIIGGSNPHCITIEAPEIGAAEIEHRFGGVLLIEPELTSASEAQGPALLWLQGAGEFPDHAVLDVEPVEFLLSLRI